MNSTGRSGGRRRPAVIGAAALAALYFLTPVAPAAGKGVMAGAVAVAAFAFLVVDAAVARLQERPFSSRAMAAVVAASALGVWGVNRSLYNFERTPEVREPVYFAERADHVLFVEKTGEGEGGCRVLQRVPKRFWLVKTFTVDLLLLACAVAAGSLLGGLVEKPSHVFAIIFMGAAMDVWSVTAGVTGRIASSAYSSYHFLLNWPLPGRGGVTYPLVGATDFLFVALFLWLSRKFQLGARRNLGAMAAGVLAAFLLAAFLGTGVPALPFIGGGVLAVNFSAIRPSGKEMVQIGVGTAAMVLAAAALTALFSPGR